MTELQKRGVQVGIVALLCLASYGFGRFEQPAKVIEHTVTKTVEVEKARSVDALVTDSSSHLVVTIHKDETRTTTPTGAVVETNHDVVTKEVVRTVFQDRVVTQEHETVREKLVDHTKIVEALKPQWAIGGGIGTELVKETVLAGDSGKVLAVPQLVLAVRAEHRFIGPAWLGLELENTGTSLSVTSPRVMLTGRIEF